MLKKLLILGLIAATPMIANGDTAVTGDGRVIENPTSNGDLKLRVNVGGVRTDALTITGATSVVSLAQPLPVASGGSGLASGTTGGLPYSTGTTTIASTAQMLAGRILIGNGSNVPTPTAVTGDVTISSTGITTIAADVVTSAKILNNQIVGADVNTGADLVVNSVQGTSHLLISTDLYLTRSSAGSGTSCDAACTGQSGGPLCIAAIQVATASTAVSCATTTSTRRCLCMNETL